MPATPRAAQRREPGAAPGALPADTATLASATLESTPRESTTIESTTENP